MQLTLSQWIGLCVTTIVVTGSDTDVLYAVPMGVIAGAMATLFSHVIHGGLDRITRPRQGSY